MYLDRLLNQGSTPLLEQWLQFSDARQHVLAEDVANISTPNYQQKDLSVQKFQSMLTDRLEERDNSGPGEVRFDDISMDVQNPARGILFHDGSNRSVDQLMSDQAKNALMHSMAVELLRQQYNTLDMALRERLS